MFGCGWCWVARMSWLGYIQDGSLCGGRREKVIYLLCTGSRVYMILFYNFLGNSIIYNLVILLWRTDLSTRSKKILISTSLIVVLCLKI